MSQLPHIHRPPLLPSYKLEPVCTLELYVAEFHGMLATEVTQPSTSIGVVTEISKSVLLVSDLQKASF